MYFGSIRELQGYFAEQGVDFPTNANPAEHVIEVVSGSLSQGRDWPSVWVKSKQCQNRSQELETLKTESAETPDEANNEYEYASTFGTQVKIVCERAFVQVRIPWALPVI